MPIVSVILTSYNHGSFIREAIDSVLNQTFQDFELIIWDDASADDSWEIIQSYHDPRIRAFCNPQNKGPVFGVNKAIFEIAQAEYIAIHNSDDVWMLGKLEKQVDFLDTHPEIGAVFTWAQIIDEYGEEQQDDHFEQSQKSRWQWLYQLFIGENHLNHPSVLIRKLCYQNVGGYRYSLAQTPDAEMWSRLLIKYPIHVIQERLTKHRLFSDKSNTSGSRVDVVIRGNNEWNIIRENYLSIADFEHIVEIFPNLEHYRHPQGFDNKFLLAMACLHECRQRNAWQLGLEWLFELLNDEASYQKIKALYAFCYADFIKLTSQFDVYVAEWDKLSIDLLNLEEMITHQSQQIIRMDEVIQAKDEAITEQEREVSRLHELIQAKDEAVTQQSQEIGRLYEVLQAKDDAVAEQSQDIGRLNAALQAKDDAIAQQSQDIGRLYEALQAKDDAVAEQSQNIGRLNEALHAKDDAIAEQSQDIGRLYDVLRAKDDAVAQQSQDIGRLNEALQAKDEAVAEQSQEIGRLYEVLQAKDEAVAQQSQDIGRLNAALQAKDDAVVQQSQDIGRLNAALHAKDDAVAEQMQEIGRLYEVLHAKDEVLTQQSQGINRLKTVIQTRDEAITQQAREIGRLNEFIQAKNEAITQQAREIGRLNEVIQAKNAAIATLNEMLSVKAIAIDKIHQSIWHRLGNALKMRPMTLHGIAKIIYLGIRLIIPKTAEPLLLKYREKYLNTRQLPVQKTNEQGTYLVKQPKTIAPVRLCVVHVIANFMTGGSSRLVVDLMEYLSNEYQHKVITSFIPDPPAYEGFEIKEIRFPVDSTPFIEYLKQAQPDFVHVHYWGDCDEPWYAKAIEAASQLGLPVIENINTPVAPYFSDAIVRYVYVSDYVRRVFGRDEPHHISIYPGSDFSHFGRSAREKIPNDCVGMVYRLEADKLNEQAIEPFIKIAQRRPQTRVLIVGGGSLLAPFQKAVELAGVTDNFEFTGYVSYDVLPELYRRMSLFIAPVWKESFGQVSPFAMNMRIPVIGFDIGAIGEIIDNPQLLAPPADAEKLADIAINLLDSPKLRKHLGQQQFARAQAYFSVQAMIKSYAKLYAEIGHTQKSASS